LQPLTTASSYRGGLIMVNGARRKAYRFGSFTLDLEREALLAADGQELALRPKSFALLRLLVASAGRLVSKEEIMDALWPNIYVTENNITQCIHDIRRALGPEAHQTLRTRSRRGYLFTPDIIAAPLLDLLPHTNPCGDRSGTGHASTGSTKYLTDEDLLADDKPLGRVGLFDSAAIASVKAEVLPQRLDEIRRTVRVQDSSAAKSLNA
jgi:DNA-binding winged helix-turn-helix (wHTH) protein